jgi:peroxin-6
MFPTISCSVKGPELLDMYVGQSESNIRDIFKRAGLSSPCVMFFDELDSLAPNRGKSSDSGGVMDRVVSQLLAELDSLHDDSNLVFVIGATNRPDLIDPALLRPGRFDRLVYLEVSNHPESRMKVLQAVTRKMNLVDVDLWDVASCCPDNVTGADISALCNRALMLAVQRKVQYMETYNLTDDDWGDERQLEVTGEDFSEALRTTVPSVSEEEISKYRQLSQFRREKSFCVTSEENQE